MKNSIYQKNSTRIILIIRVKTGLYRNVFFLFGFFRPQKNQIRMQIWLIAVYCLFNAFTTDLNWATNIFFFIFSMYIQLYLQVECKHLLLLGIKNHSNVRGRIRVPLDPETHIGSYLMSLYIRHHCIHNTLLVFQLISSTERCNSIQFSVVVLKLINSIFNTRTKIAKTIVCSYNFNKV